MNFQMPNTRPVTSSEQVSFHCKRCGACCRHVRESVPLNTLDAYRLAKYLRGRGEHIDCLDTVFAHYTEPVLLHESGLWERFQSRGKNVLLSYIFGIDSPTLT